MQMQMQAYQYQYHPQNLTAAAAAGDGVQFMRRLPLGYRFQPTDEEIILEYLMKKINNEALPSNIINTAEVYASNPDHLSERFRSSGDGEWYFFTPIDRKHKNGRRVDRTAGGGHWRPGTSDINIKHNGKIIGSRKQLNYFKGTSRDSIKTDWLMQEFRGTNSGTTQENSKRLDDWVVCKVYKKRTIAGRKMIGDVVNRIGSSRKRNGEVKNNTVDSEAIQLSVDNSIVIASPSPSSSSINGGLLADNLYSPEGLGSASIASSGWPNLGQNALGSSSSRNIYDEAKIDEGNDNRASNAAKHQYVESSSQISTARRSNAIHMYPQPFPNSASELESCYWRADSHSQLQVQQGHDQLNVEHQALSQQPAECICHDPLSGPSSSCSPQSDIPLPLPYHHQQGSDFIYDKVDEGESYSDNF